MMVLCSGLALQAQRSRLVDTGWQSLSADSVRPWCGFGVGLDEGWQDSVYTASIQYPQLHRIGIDDLNRWGLSADEVPEWPVIETNIGVSRGNATFDAGFMPVIKTATDTLY